MKNLPRELLKHWKETTPHPDKFILRLSILRDLSRQLHAERSMHLAQGKIPQGQTLEQLETRLQAVRRRADLVCSLGLAEILETPVAPDPRGPDIPGPLTAVIPRAKLERYDRHWEGFLAASAFEKGWSFWELHATIAVPKAEAFHKHLSQVLWPKGVILFVESSATVRDPDPASGWTGRWLIIAISAMDPTHLGVERSPGFLAGHRGGTPSWRRLFPEKLG